MAFDFKRLKTVLKSVVDPVSDIAELGVRHVVAATKKLTEAELTVDECCSLEAWGEYFYMYASSCVHVVFVTPHVYSYGILNTYTVRQYLQAPTALPSTNWPNTHTRAVPSTLTL